jgi:hypothetical protein
VNLVCPALRSFGVALLTAATTTAIAQGYPTRPAVIERAKIEKQ